MSGLEQQLLISTYYTDMYSVPGTTNSFWAIWPLKPDFRSFVVLHIGLGSGWVSLRFLFLSSEFFMIFLLVVVSSAVPEVLLSTSYPYPYIV